ncbi:hypothetical protein KEM52_002982, partial [Ascosphaera acerosa]
RYAKRETAKRGKPESALTSKSKPKPTISKGWISESAWTARGPSPFSDGGWRMADGGWPTRMLIEYFCCSCSVVLAFVVCGGFFLELFNFLPHAWSMLTAALR